MRKIHMRTLAIWILSGVLLLLATTGTAWAHVRPATTDPAPDARLDNSPQRISITYDGALAPPGSSMTLLDGGGNAVPTSPQTLTGDKQASISPNSALGPGPYTLDWISVDSQDGHSAQGFYTFVVNGGPVGIINGEAQSQAPAADLMATLAVGVAPDGASLLRVDLNNSSGVERVRVRLSRPDLGEDLLDTRPSGDGGWVINGNEVAVPGTWHAVVIVRRTNIFDDAQAAFDFSVDPATGSPNFS
jgi:methionine-rich copper-binding protein CopC